MAFISRIWWDQLPINNCHQRSHPHLQYNPLLLLRRCLGTNVGFVANCSFIHPSCEDTRYLILMSARFNVTNVPKHSSGRISCRSICRNTSRTNIQHHPQHLNPDPLRSRVLFAKMRFEVNRYSSFINFEFIQDLMYRWRLSNVTDPFIESRHCSDIYVNLMTMSVKHHRLHNAQLLLSHLQHRQQHHGLSQWMIAMKKCRVPFRVRMKPGTKKTKMLLRAFTQGCCLLKSVLIVNIVLKYFPRIGHCINISKALIDGDRNNPRRFRSWTHHMQQIRRLNMTLMRVIRLQIGRQVSPRNSHNTHQHPATVWPDITTCIMRVDGVFFPIKAECEDCILTRCTKEDVLSVWDFGEKVVFDLHTCVLKTRHFTIVHAVNHAHVRRTIVAFSLLDSDGVTISVEEQQCRHL